MYTNIFIFGDSVSFGCYDAIGGWAQRFDNFLAGEFISGRGAEYWVYNQSTPIGDTSKDILDRLEVELKPRMRNGDNKENILIFAIGINDSAFAHDKNDQWVVLADFKNNLKNLMLISKKIIPKVIFIGLTPVNQELTDPASFSSTIPQMLKYLSRIILP